MANLLATTYKGFSKVSGHLGLEAFFTSIGSSARRPVNRKINRLVREGSLQEVANVQTQQLLIQVLERDGFAKRTNANGLTEYGVRTLTMEEIEKNSGEAHG